MWSKNDNKENFDYKDTVKNRNYIYLVHRHTCKYNKKRGEKDRKNRAE